MTTLQVLGAMLVGGMIFGWPIALLIRRLVENDARYPEPRLCEHPPRTLRIDGVYSPDCGFGVDMAGCVTCMQCGNTWNCGVRPDFARGFGYADDSRHDGADVLPFPHVVNGAAAGQAPHATQVV